MAEDEGERLHLFLSFHHQARHSMFWDISKKPPRMLNAPTSVIRLIAMYSIRISEAVCLACGIITENFVNPCLLWGRSNSSYRQKMCISIWHKFGDDVYLRLAGCDDETLLTVARMFGNFDLISFIVDGRHKMDFY